MNVLQMKNIYKAYYNERKDTARVVLKDISLDVEENEFVCILGPSGCGKTTLLNLLAGFEKPLSGDLLYRGNPIKGPSSERAVVFQEYSLLPWLSVKKNVEFSINKKYSSQEKTEIAEKYLKLVGLSEFSDAMPNSLSGGMKQRVAIARTLAMEPDVLLMDEPFSSLDEQTKSVLDKELLSIWNNDKKTVIFITHSIDEALLLGTRVILLSTSPGKIHREWSLTEYSNRNPTSDEIVALKKEILSELGVCSCVKGVRPIIPMDVINDEQ